MEKISVIVPIYNEEDSINIFYKELKKVINKMNNTFEIIFVDDGSHDNSLSIIKRLSKHDKSIRYISFSRNFGKEAAMYAGLSYSTGDMVTIMDVDLQDPPELLISMYDGITLTDYDVCALYSYEHKDYPFIRRVLTNIWYKIFNLISSNKQMPGARDCRLMKRKVVDSILRLGEYNRYIKGIFGYVGYKTFWIEYETPDRKVGTSKFPLFKLFRYALEAIVAFSTTPLVISAFIGILFCLIAFIAIIFIIFKTIMFGDPVSGWPSLACIIIFVSGVQLFFLGVIGLYLSKMYLEVKKRPVYIINETEKDL